VGMAYLMVTYGAWATLLSLIFLMLLMSAAVWMIRRKITAVQQ